MKYEDMTDAQKTAHWDKRRKETSAMYDAVRLADFSLQAKWIMLDKNISKKELALRLGWPTSVVSDWLSGTANLSILQMYSIADALGVPLTISMI
jgi:ribosome-binding protein aMBF1 (putative translation factor)